MNCCACTAGADRATAATAAAPINFGILNILPKPAAKLDGRGAEVNRQWPKAGLRQTSIRGRPQAVLGPFGALETMRFPAYCTPRDTAPSEAGHIREHATMPFSRAVGLS